MNAFLLYNLYASALLTVFYIFWRLLLVRETFFRLNRVVLLTVALLSLVLPLCHITLPSTLTATASFTADGHLSTSSPIVHQLQTIEVMATSLREVSEGSSLALLGQLLTVILVSGMLLCLGRTFWGVISLRHLIRNSQQHVLDDGLRVAVSELPLAPCSWMHTIVMSSDDYAGNCKAIMAHERAHIRCGHSYDVLLMELFTALQWWNPVAWFLRQDLRTLHEYEADASVLSQGFDTKRYVQLLMRKAQGLELCPLANGITIKNAHKTKQRILMMLKTTTSPRRRRLRVLYILPVIAVSLTLSAKTVDDHSENMTTQLAEEGLPPTSVADATQRLTETLASSTAAFALNEPVEASPAPQPEEQNTPTATAVHTRTAAPAQQDAALPDDVCVQAEVLPSFQGGEQALFQFIAQNIRYPLTAMDAGVQGRVVVQFVVEKDGKVSDIHIQRTDKSSLDEVIVSAYRPDMTEDEMKERQNAQTHNAAVKAIHDEAIRVVKTTSGKWIPGSNKGQPVRVQFSLPITFRLQ